MTTAIAKPGPAFQDRKSPVLDILRAVDAGKMDWDAAAKTLISRTWATPPTVPGKPTDPGWADAVDDNDPSDTVGSWPEFQKALDFGMVTPAQYQQVATARWAAKHGTAGGAADTAPQGKGLRFVD